MKANIWRYDTLLSIYSIYLPSSCASLPTAVNSGGITHLPPRRTTLYNLSVQLHNF